MSIYDVVCSKCGHTAGLHGSDIGMECSGDDCRCHEMTNDIVVARLAEAERLLKNLCKATNPADAYGWFFDEMRSTTRKEREAAEKFLKQ